MEGLSTILRGLAAPARQAFQGIAVRIPFQVLLHPKLYPIFGSWTSNIVRMKRPNKSMRVVHIHWAILAIIVKTPKLKPLNIPNGKS